MSSLTMSSARCSFAGKSVAFRPAVPVRAATTAVVPLRVEASRVCDLTGTKRNKANVVTFSNKKNRKWQYPNLQEKKIFWEQGQRWVKLKITTRALKTVERNGLDAMAKEAGVDLWSLPFEDARPQRLAYLEANPRKVPVAKNPRKMKNEAKLAASKKQPRYAVYEPGGRIVWVRPGQEEAILGAAEEAPAAAPQIDEDGELKINVQQ